MDNKFPPHHILRFFQNAPPHLIGVWQMLAGMAAKSSGTNIEQCFHFHQSLVGFLKAYQKTHNVNDADVLAMFSYEALSTIGRSSALWETKQAIPDKAPNKEDMQ